MATPQRNIGLLGGSFDPVHKGHIAIATAALEAFNLDEVRLMPCAQQALKDDSPAPAADRCALLRFAIATNPKLTLDCRELYRGGKTYTYDTLLELTREAPDARFWFIIGMDSVCSFDKWYRAADLINMCEFIAFDRPGVEAPDVPFHPALLAHHLKGPLMNISSREIRACLASQQPILHAVGALEARYIEDHQLYHCKGN